MRIEFVEMAGFRGFKDLTRFEFPRGFAVLNGRNGTGKSTVLDALDYVLTGTINKYEVKEAKGGGLSKHIWWVGEGAPSDEYVSVGFVSDSGERHVITRSRTKGLDATIEKMARILCLEDYSDATWAETLVRTSLIRDEQIARLSLDLTEQARFAAVRAAIGTLGGADHGERTAEIVRAAASAKSEQEGRVRECEAELGRALGALTEARSITERQADVAEAERIIDELVPTIRSFQGDRAEALRRHIVEQKQAVPALTDAVSMAEQLHAEWERIQSPSGGEELANAGEALRASRVERERAARQLEGSRQRESLELAKDTFATHMMALIDHGEAIGLQDGRCPLCGALHSAAEFAAAVAAARSGLSTRGSGLPEAAAAVEAARLALQESESKLAASEQLFADLQAQRARITGDLERIATRFEKLGFRASPLEPDVARKLLLKRQEDTARLEHALLILEASSAHDRVATIERRADQLRGQVDEESARLAICERALDGAKQIESSARSVANQALTEQFDTVMPLLKELYRRLRPHADWRELETDFGGRVRASLNFTVGDGQNPQFVFSSGQRRAAGIAFLLAIHLSRPWCRLRSLLLDDPVQHIDDYRALNLVEVLAAVRRMGRQVIVAVEDPALAEVLCRRLRSSTVEGGRRFDLRTSENGSATIERQTDIYPLPREILGSAA